LYRGNHAQENKTGRKRKGKKSPTNPNHLLSKKAKAEKKGPSAVIFKLTYEWMSREGGKKEKVHAYFSSSSSQRKG